MDRQRIQDYLEHMAAYRASCKKASEWAAKHDVPLRSLASWCAHAGRWQAQLDGVSLPVVPKPVAFVAARLPAVSPASAVRIELQTGTTAVTLHWPTAHILELAASLQAMAR